MLFTGHAEIKDSGGNERQIGLGQLIILDSNGNKVGAIDPEGNEIFEFDAISGPQGNGLLPNGLYDVKKPIMGGVFSDEKGLTYKMPVNPKGELKKGFQRFALLIHPTQHYHPEGYMLNGVPQYITVYTEGCIGLLGHNNAAPFLKKMLEYFKTHSFIELKVDIAGNANIKIQLKSKTLPK